MSLQLVFIILWLCTVSGCTGCAIGMALMYRRQTDVGQTPVPVIADFSEASPSRDEISSLLRALVEINSQIDSRGGDPPRRIEEITEELEAVIAYEPLVRTAKLLVAANHRLHVDLNTAKRE